MGIFWIRWCSGARRNDAGRSVRIGRWSIVGRRNGDVRMLNRSRALLLLLLGITGVVRITDAEDTLLFHADGTWENGYAWPPEYSPAPDFGSFAECYSGDGTISSIVLFGTQTGFESPVFFDAFVWADDVGGQPGSVLCIRVGNGSFVVAFWPAATRMDVELDGCCVSGNWWVGFWGRWSGDPGFWIVADLNGPNQGCPMTKVAPGLPYPEGWQNTSVVWKEPARSLAIGATVAPCAPSPVLDSTWGRVKSLYTRNGTIAGADNRRGRVQALESGRPGDQ